MMQIILTIIKAFWYLTFNSFLQPKQMNSHYYILVKKNHKNQLYKLFILIEINLIKLNTDFLVFYI